MKLYLSDIEKAFESDEINADVKRIIEVFIYAINDWPTAVFSVDDYQIEAEKFIKGKIDKNSLEARLKKIDCLKYAWQSESLVQLLDIFQFYGNNVSIKEIIDDLKVKLQKGE